MENQIRDISHGNGKPTDLPYLGIHPTHTTSIPVQNPAPPLPKASNMRHVGIVQYLAAGCRELEFDDYNLSITINGPKVEIGVVGEAAGVPVKTSAEIEDFGVKFGDILHHEGVGEGVNEGVKARLEKELLFLSEHGHIRRPEMEGAFRISTATTERDLALLRRLGLIIFQGPPKTGRYVLTDKGKRIFKMI